nr:glycosyltransferase [candidate division Zixibacteria bacterium]
MRKIKVLYIIDNLIKGAGTENQLLGLITHLDKSEFFCTMVTLQPLNIEIRSLLGESGCDYLCLDVNKLLSLNGLKAMMRLRKYIRNNRIDIVQTFFIDANIIGVMTAFLAGHCRCVVSRRDLGYWYTPRLLFYLRRLNRLADYFLVNAEAVKKVVSKTERVKPEKIKVIYNGVFKLPGEVNPNINRRAFNIPAEASVVGIVANLRPVKRLDVFIRMAASLPNQNVYFMIIGKGDERDNLLNLAREMKLDSRLIITHSAENIYDYISLFDIGVLTSDSEGLSNTLIEYQLCGIPAVAFEVGGNGEIIVDGQTGFLIAEKDPLVMAERISLLLNDRPLRDEMGRAAAASAKTRFAGDKMIKDTCDFYKSIAGSN